MTCRFCTKTRQIAATILQHATPSRRPFPPRPRPGDPIKQLTISIDRASDGERVWVTTDHTVASWYRIEKVIINDRRSDIRQG
jgi:hypothetical protein